jgi:hypothetical protein
MRVFDEIRVSSIVVVNEILFYGIKSHFSAAKVQSFLIIEQIFYSFFCFFGVILTKN